MPIYEYQCECGKDKEVRLSFGDADQPQICGCGKTMRKKVSLSSFSFKPTGESMALDSLNNGVTGGKRKAWAEEYAATGF